ncbi:MAG: tRNA-dihydrouridine synthase family protein [Deltaproteobacteria bacterium]|nr:tRNA-dihydrouridine synthase family protein [Deltaproteobacteria bacterium]
MTLLPVPDNNDTGPHICLAPIRGLTDALFRNVFRHHFKGIDAALAPFINPQRKALFSDRMLSDLLPQNNTTQPVIPQLLHTWPEDFLLLASRLADLGYTHINWNLGCPAPMVARKKRGSGLLPYPDEIISFLDEVLPKLPVQLSIKTRLGFSDKNELLQLLPRLNDFPLREIIIHTRLGSQLYRGETDPESFASCRKVSIHTLVYNGDINSLDDFSSLAGQFPGINRWMVGRGLLMNPFLAEEIKSFPGDTKANRSERIYHFHRDLSERYEEKLSGPGHLLSRMKQLWAYLISSFPGKEKEFKKLRKSSTRTQYMDSVNRIFDN